MSKRRALTRLAGAPISAADLSRGAEKDAKPSVSALLSSPPPRSPDGSKARSGAPGARQSRPAPRGVVAAWDGAVLGAL
jgi:hypothetical protein